MSGGNSSPVPGADPGAGQHHIGPLLGRFVGLLVCLTLLLAGLLALLPGSAHAQDDVTDPPARVGRVARIEGRVTLQARDSSDEVDSPRNWPVTSGDLVSTGDDARAELRIGATVLRLGEYARLRVVRLDDEAIELHLQRGSLAVMPWSDAAAREITVSSQAGRFMPQGEGFFRIDAGHVAGTTPGATAWRAGLTVEQAGGSFTLRPGQYAELFAEGGWRVGQPVSDDFARWAMQPDEPQPAADTAQLPPDMTGAEDLRWYGDWQRSDDWGPIWYPRDVRADWAPYREGRWAWVAPWGWTWIDDAPWGFAPFHYGRWVHWRGRWGWVPGEARLRPVYAPALVAWSDQPGSNFSRTTVWFPLGPREIFVPSYRCTPRHRDVINLPYLRQPVPYAERHRHDAGPRRDARPFYRYAEIEHARSLLPRNLFEQARRPIDTVHRRDERARHDDAPGRGLPPREARDRRDQRDRRDGVGGNRIESIQLAPGLREAIGGGTSRDGRGSAPADSRERRDPVAPVVQPPPRDTGRDGRDNTRPPGRDGRGGDEQRPVVVVPVQPVPAPPPTAAMPLPASPAVAPGHPPDGRGQARPDIGTRQEDRADQRGEHRPDGRGDSRADVRGQGRGEGRGEGRPTSRDEGREPVRDNNNRPPPAAQNAAVVTPGNGAAAAATPTQRTAVPQRMQPPAVAAPAPAGVPAPARPPVAAPPATPTPAAPAARPLPGVDAGNKGDGRTTPANNEQRRKRGEELR
jgi:hypothetical protein